MLLWIEIIQKKINSSSEEEVKNIVESNAA